MADPPQNPGRKAHKHQRHFDTEHLQGQLKRRSVRSGAVTMLSQIAMFVLGIGYLAVLGRQLTPGEFGIIDSILPFTGIALLLMDLGLAMATVQRAEVNQGQISTLFWANVLLAMIVAIAIIAAAPLVAMFYDNKEIMWPMMGFAGVAIISGLGIQHMALLRRQMKFKTVAQIMVIGTAVGNIAAITSAFLGASYWSIVIMRIAYNLCVTTGVWIKCDWRPGPPVRKSGVRSMLSFGTNLAGTNVLSYLSRNVDTLLLAWKYGTESVGLYQRAYRLVLMPMQKLNGPVTTVAIPTLSRLQDQPERYRAFYRQGLMLLVALSMPLVAFCFAVADTMILAVLGDQWDAAVPIFRALGPAAYMNTFNVATTWVFVSLGATNRQFRLSVVTVGITLIGFIVALPWGALGVALSFSVTRLLIRPPSILYCFRDTSLRFRDVMSAIWQAMSASILAGVAVWYFDSLLTANVARIVLLMLDAFLYAILYMAIWVSLPGGYANLKSMSELAKDLRANRKKKSIERLVESDPENQTPMA